MGVPTVHTQLPQGQIEDDLDLDSSQTWLDLAEHLVGHKVTTLAPFLERERLLPTHVDQSKGPLAQYLRV